MITKLKEKMGGRAKLEQEAGHFKDFIERNLLIDLQYCNGIHTWSNRRSGKHSISSKLDRFLISDNVVHLGGDISSTILPYSGSDHWLISLQWQRPGNAMRRPFHFEAFWLTHPAFKYLISTFWKNFRPPEGSKMFLFQQKLKSLKAHIKSWNHNTSGNIFQDKEDLISDLRNL